MQLRQKLIVPRKVNTLKFAADAVSYRIPRRVKQMTVLKNGESYPVCPRCDISIDREYMSFCDRCGQCLSWKRYPNVAIRWAGGK